MTRRQELEDRALKFMTDEHAEPSDLVHLLASVEREVWLKASDMVWNECEGDIDLARFKFRQQAEVGE